MKIYIFIKFLMSNEYYLLSLEVLSCNGNFIHSGECLDTLKYYFKFPQSYLKQNQFLKSAPEILECLLIE